MTSVCIFLLTQLHDSHDVTAGLPAQPYASPSYSNGVPVTAIARLQGWFNLFHRYTTELTFQARFLGTSTNPGASIITKF
jgi:hypothetical protein